ncbi:MAG: hypothetical protein K0S23_3325 [Fluviicola sp.]|jgi:hypothetical protein|uniref:hypothetical protein n=1 Tax=Fluviicola sp. TaxID=1917219 RepID=UPI0026124B0E|nr:hypothetical protein [Fluviicola sp.]MDF3029018.1 hypothetical protein [Fluviicola sp.]
MLPNIGIEANQQKEIHLKLKSFFQNSKLDFMEQLKAYYNYQLELVEKHGREGLMVFLDTETQVYVDGENNRSLEIMHYSDVPESCPWYKLHLLPRDEAIRKTWEKFPIEFVDSLEKYTLDLFAIFEAEKWYLAYAYQVKDYDGNVYYQFLGGREPNSDAKLPKDLMKAGWKMPEDLKELYSVHGNFGNLKGALRNQLSHCIAAAEKLETSLTFLEDKIEEWELDYSFFDLLPFWEDDAGNCQNFYKPEAIENSYATVDWDHETKEVSGYSTLAEFIDYQFGRTLREDH